MGMCGLAQCIVTCLEQDEQTDMNVWECGLAQCIPTCLAFREAQSSNLGSGSNS